MVRVFVWLLIIGAAYFAYQAGFFHNIGNYFSESAAKARQEKVIEHEDGSYTTIKYRNVFDVLLNK